MNVHEIFREMTMRICGNLSIDQALADGFGFLSKVMPLNVWALSAIENGLEGLRVVALASDHGPLSVGETVVIPLSRESRDFLNSTRPGKAYVYNRNDEVPPTMQTAGWYGIDRDFSAACMRLVIRGDVVGSTMLTAWGHERFTEEHARILESLNEPLSIALVNALRYQEVLRLRDLLAEDRKALQADMMHLTGERVVGAGGGLKEVMQMVHQVAGLNSPVLLLGDTGVGKEVFANEIHRLSRRCEGPLIKVNCGAIPETLMDSELFGHERGAFTGALGRKRGRFERAHNGTLFLDEVGELPPAAQMRFLRVLQHMEIERVGGVTPVPVNVRVIGATHRDLERMVRAGRFREDLWYRLNIFPIRIPALAEHREDIPALTRYLLRKKASEMNLGKVPELGPGAMGRLMAYDWPGNVRELENLVERAVILHAEGPLDFPDLGRRGRDYPRVSASNGKDPVLTLDEAAGRHIRHVLHLSGGRIEGKGGAAELLGIQPNTLRARMKKLGILFGRKAGGSQV